MSLISAAADINDSSSTASNGSTRQSQVYRKDGKPLSKEALYRAKQKYGVYQSPARSTGTGVSDAKMASDVAANLANNNRTTIEAYKRLMVDSDASKAATAVSSRSRASSVSSNVTAVSDKRSTSAATKALAAKPVEVPVTTNKLGMDMSKVLSGAEAAAGKRMGIRSNPEKIVYVHSKDSAKAAERSFSLTPEIMDKISTKGQLEAEAELEADPKKYASQAAYAVRDFNPNEKAEKELLEREKRKQAYFGMLTSPQVLAMAKTNAQFKLDSMDKAAPGSLYRNAEFNKLAVALAQKNSSQRSVHSGKINMGGGLWLSQADVQNIAQGLITPVLDEVDSRALQQRAMDEDIKQRKIDYKDQNTAWIELQRNKLGNDKMYSRETRLRHKRETEGLHTRTERRFESLVTTKDSEVAEMEKALQDAKNSYAALQKQMEQALIDEEKRCETELVNLAQEQKDDLALARTEQTEQLQPYIDDLRAAETEHERLVAEREAIAQAIADLRTSIQNHKVRIEELDKELVDTAAKHEDEEAKLQDLTTEKEQFNEKIDTHFVVLAQKAKEQALQSSEESRLRQLEVDAMINERQGELNITELHLKNEKLVLLDAMRDVTQLKGEEKLDEDKVKALIGMTSDEFIAKQKASEKSAASAADETKYDKTGEKSTSTETIHHEEGVLETKEPSGKTEETSDKTISKPKTTTVAGAKPSMVDAVLPPDFKPEATPKATKKQASPAKEAVTPAAQKNGLKRSTSLKDKIKGLVYKDSPKTTPEAAKPVTKAAKPVAATPAAPKLAVTPKDTTKTPAIQEEPETKDVEPATKVVEPATVKPTVEKAISKPEAIASPEVKAVKATSDDASPRLNTSSSEFPLDAPENTKDAKILVNSDDDELPDSSEPGEVNAPESDKKASLFKEVF
ncbi:LANO_0H13058g1_1 [Lachancea nothofagi CBS 11611]|uniref:LANO_0H13058g1_1 n=1 Tax=Lachancea nothofagi CBS 11611 TaxID=1266666 RepID=A0A1G4KMI7_9SACH|nr:LANO_0H13058g1_1 [Lachancea nothofagi CBS 11611]